MAWNKGRKEEAQPVDLVPEASVAPPLAGITLDAAAGAAPGCRASIMRGHRCKRDVAVGAVLCENHLAMGWTSPDESQERQVIG
jgi:hypothetical protein